MKRIILAGVILVMLASFAWAMGPFMPTVLSSSKVVQLKGKVVQVNQNNYGCMKGCGPVVLQTAKGDVTLYGLGPMWYWNRQNVNLPKTGEQLTVNAFEVNVNGATYYVAKDVTFANGQTLVLRDNNGYCPWMKNGGMHGHMNGNMMNNNMHNNMNNGNMMNCPGMMNNMNHQ